MFPSIMSLKTDMQILQSVRRVLCAGSLLYSCASPQHRGLAPMGSVVEGQEEGKLHSGITLCHLNILLF